MTDVSKTPAARSCVSLFLRCSALFALGLASATLVAASRWPALDPADLADRAPRIDPEAGAEILLREIVLDDTDDDVTAIEYFVRIKVYSERSLEKLSKIEIFYSRDDRIHSLSARTHRPDGTVVELGRKDIFERDVIKTGDYRQRVKAFSPPGLQVGAIVEYRYTRIMYDGLRGLPFSFQADHPTRVVRFRVRPYTHPRVFGRLLGFSYPKPLPQPDQDGFYHVEMRDVRAQVDEPMQSSAIRTEPTLLLYYTDEYADNPTRYWDKRSSELFKESEAETKPGKAVRAAVESTLAAGDSADDKLRKLYNFSRSRIKRRDLESSGFTDEQRAKFRANESPEDTLKAGHGTRRDIIRLFVSMARAAGFEARYAWCNDVSSIPFDPKITGRFALPDLVAAVKVGDAWQYHDPASIYLPFGTLSWENSGTAILVAEKSAAKFASTPIQPAEASRRVRTATLSLQPDGTLEGEVTILYSGLWEAEEKNDYDGKTPKELSDLIVDLIRTNQPLAEVTKVKVDNAAHPLDRLQISFHLRIPEYAERTGSRLFLQPAVLHKGAKPLFESTTRKSEVSLRYRYSSEDRILITLPENFELESPSAPADLELPQVAHYKVELGMLRGTRQLQYTRVYSSNIISVPVKYYATFKAVFDAINSRDQHAITLKRTASKSDPAPETTR